MVGKQILHFKNVRLYEFVIMTNHIHGIIIINDRRGEVTSPLRNPTLGQIIAYYKYQSTKQVNKFRKTPGEKVWQRNYFEHIIRNEKSLYQIRRYIIDNPLHWEKDSENPQNWGLTE